MRRPATLLIGASATMLCLLAASPVGASGNQAALTQAKKSLLVRADLPKGWVSMKSSSSSGPAIPGEAQLAACLKVPTGVIADNPPTANSPEFQSQSKLLIVNDSVSVYRSTKAAKADFSAAGNAKTPACLTSVLNGPAKAALSTEVGGSGATIGTIQVTKAPASDFAPHSASVTAYLPVTVMEHTLNVQLTLVDYVKGTEDQTVTLVSIQQSFPKSLAHHLTTVASDRL